MGCIRGRVRATRVAAVVFSFAFVVSILTPTALADPPSHGAPIGEITGLNKACGVAVDSKGDVYASSASDGKVKVYDPANALLTEISNANEPCGLAVDSKGNLYVSEKGTGKVVRYKPNAFPFAGTPTYGSAEAIDSSGSAKGIAVDRTDDRLYVAEGNHVAIYKSDGSFEANVGEGNLTSATGVAAYTYIYTGSVPTNLKRHSFLTVADDAGDQVKVFAAKEGSALKLRKTISGIDHDENPETSNQAFGFGAQGAYLAADPGNESRETRKCAQVQFEAKNQACTQGHFYLYDAAHNAVDEFDATGEFVDQIKNGGFEDAGPTAIAVERSGVTGDGTLYVTAGSSAGAKVLTFAPLLAPFREPLTALSRVLNKARGVATDCEGYVYVAAETSIRVYDPEGKEVTSFVDAAEPRDLAADCAGRVYVVDINAGKAVLTYYTPSTPTPIGTTTYTRHEPLIAEEEGDGLQSVAINPLNGHAFAVGSTNAQFPPIILEFASPSEASKVVGECGAGFLPSQRLDIDVYGATGEVYVTASGQNLATIRCGEAPELLSAQIKGGGCPNGEIGSNPALAIDQSNGHILEYANNQTGGTAREYDSSGSCVTEFGTFSSGSGGYRLAVDNSCALHKPPLTEQTTPKCSSLYPSNGNAYVAWDGPENVTQPFDVNAFGPLEYPPPPGEPPTVETGEADGFGPGKVTLHGTVNPNSSQIKDCRFEYLTEDEYQNNGETFAGAEAAPCAETPGEIGNGGQVVSVHVDLEGLEIATPYRYRLSATNDFGTGLGDAEPFILQPPVIKAKSALPIAYDEATLRGEVDPAGSATEYHFEYLTQALYQKNGETFAGAQSTPTDELPASEGPIDVEAPVTGLEEGAEYRFRLVAENAVSSATTGDLSFETLVRPPLQDCENAEYRTGFSALLPDCRAYELVTPAQVLSTSGGLLSLGAFTSTAAGSRFANSWFVALRGAEAGESISYKAIIPGIDNHFFHAEREQGKGAHPKGGWHSEGYGFSFAQGRGGDGEPGGVSSDQDYMFHAVLGNETPTDRSLPVGAYLRVPSGTANEECTPEPEEFELVDPKGEFELVGCGKSGTDPDADGRFVSVGGTHVIFTSKVPLDEGAPLAGAEAIYSRKAGEAKAEVVSVGLDNETPFGAPRYLDSTEDGAAVVFNAGSLGGPLYVHRNGKTTQVAEGENTYAGVSADGKRVFFIDEGFFPGGGGVAPPPADLFACDVEGGNCAGPKEEQEPIEIASKASFVNVSGDGSHVFFTSEEALTGVEASENGEEAEDGVPNLYAWDSEVTHFVGVLDPQDLVSFRSGSTPEEEQNREDLVQWTSTIPGQRSSSGSGYESGRSFSPTRSTPDGEILVFQSHAQLTSYDNEGKGEIYRYDPAAAPGSQLSCVSCSPTGAPHNAIADALFRSPFQGVTESSTMIPNLTDDGRRVFFESHDPLLPEDANQVIDIYEWKAPGTAGPGGDTCERARGCLALISTGQSEQPTYLFGLGADGEDVFLITQEKLVGADLVGTFSIYDARVLGGIPDPPVKAPCPGDACQGQGSTPPVLPAPGSTGSGVAGAPSTSRPPCPKGKHRVKGRCVKKKSSKRKHQRKHSKKRRAGHEQEVGR